MKFRRRENVAPFLHPMHPAPRTAILAAGFRAGRNARLFEQGWCPRAARFQPQSIAAPLDQLRRLANLDLRVEHSVIAFTYEGDGGLSFEDRELFWRAFDVPIFEQYLDGNNRLLAFECDAHSGLHVVREYEHLAVDRELCACGHLAPRISRGTRFNELVDLLA